MSPSLLLGMVAAFGVGAVTPTGKNTKQRFGLGAILAATVWLVVSLWPDPSSAAVNAKPSEWPYLLTLLVFTPIVSSVAVLFLPR